MNTIAFRRIEDEDAGRLSLMLIRHEAGAVRFVLSGPLARVHGTAQIGKTLPTLQARHDLWTLYGRAASARLAARIAAEALDFATAPAPRAGAKR